jgi:hypothetical protein
LALELTLSGLMDAVCAEESGALLVQAHKPTWEKGAVASLPIKALMVRA